jgi:hypothetical protein
MLHRKFRNISSKGGSGESGRVARHQFQARLEMGIIENESAKNQKSRSALDRLGKDADGKRLRIDRAQNHAE